LRNHDAVLYLIPESQPILTGKEGVMTLVTRQTLDPKKQLIKELAAVGFKKDAFDLLPEWWEDAIAHPSGVHEIRGFLAKHLHLNVGADGALCGRDMPKACFKTRSGTPIDKIASARSFASGVASVVAFAAKHATPWKGFPDAASLRQEMLGKGRPWIGLTELLEICWSHGAPVVFLPTLPVNSPKMEGMVVYCRERPVILVTTKRAEDPSLMLFILAHEMGHLACGHIEPGSTLVDEKIEGEVDDGQEKEANRYAIDLISGGKNIQMPRLIRAKELARVAADYGARHQMEPGHVIMNAVKNTVINGETPWALAMAALKHLPGAVTSADLTRQALRSNIDMDALSDDGFEFLERLKII
jgi:Zn-dependent peptidase ImmA (M78 family)